MGPVHHGHGSAGSALNVEQEARLGHLGPEVASELGTALGDSGLRSNPAAATWGLTWGVYLTLSES